MYSLCICGREKQEEHVCAAHAINVMEDVWTSFLRVMGGGAPGGRDA